MFKGQRGEWGFFRACVAKVGGITTNMGLLGGIPPFYAWECTFVSSCF